LRELTFVEAAREGLAEEMERDPRVFVVGQGIGARGGNFNTTLGLYDRFGPERLRDVPIAERGFVGMCTGAAATGARPVVDFMFVDFIADAFGELIHQTGKLQYMSNGRLKMPIVLRGCYGIGGAAATHHSGAYYSLFVHQPGFRVAIPSNPADAKGLLKTAIRSDDPVFFLEHKSLLNSRGPVPDGEHLVAFGQARIVRAGGDATLVAIGNMVPRALAAGEALAADGIAVEVIDPRTVAPLDVDTILGSVEKTGRLVILEEDYAPCSVASEIAAQVADRGFDLLDAPIKRLNTRPAPVPYSPPLEAALVPSPDDVVGAIRALLR
jgi:2-oxoisovalerate dehydrogenase E1 component